MCACVCVKAAFPWQLCIKKCNFKINLYGSAVTGDFSWYKKGNHSWLISKSKACQKYFKEKTFCFWKNEMFDFNLYNLNESCSDEFIWFADINEKLLSIKQFKGQMSKGLMFVVYFYGNNAHCGHLKARNSKKWNGTKVEQKIKVGHKWVRKKLQSPDGKYRKFNVY